MRAREGHFRRAVFQAALDAGSPVQPVRIRYRRAGGAASTAPAFVGDDSLLASAWRVVTARGLVAEVEVREAIAPDSHRTGQPSHRTAIAPDSRRTGWPSHRAGHGNRRALARAAQREALPEPSAIHAVLVS